jgi:hypothetical protein
MGSPIDPQNAGHAEKREHAVEILIDGNPVKAPDHSASEGQLLALIGKKIEDAYLVLIKGKRERESFKDRPDEQIKLHKGMKFVTVNVGPTPVS